MFKTGRTYGTFVDVMADEYSAVEGAKESVDTFASERPSSINTVGL